jgi:hypothetical protein
MKSIFIQAEDETPYEFIDRVLRTVAYRCIFFAVAMFMAGYFLGDKV